MIDRNYLKLEYELKGHSAAVISKNIGCSETKVNYWLHKHGIQKRTISEAVYLKNNPCGDPFFFKKPQNEEEWFLYGLGLGLFWGEGNKVNRHSVRLGNTDPDLIAKFLEFLKCIYRVDTNRLRFGLQIFSDCHPNTAKRFWRKKLNISNTQFQKVIITKTSGDGTYKHKNKYGVLTVYFSNVKLRDMIISAIEELRIVK